MRGFRFKPADYAIIGLLLLLGFAGLWYNLQRGFSAQHKYAVVYVNNRPVAELSLGENRQFQHTIPFGDRLQYQAILEVDGGRVRMLPISEELCPRGICAHTGWIEHAYESIVCLPNRIMVVFTEPPGEDDDDIDGVTF